ncbi:MAG: aminotransferase class I/II-fold pyridoxal phosphate-dependent enzyme, partial [Thermoguttaceae bacterium]|nr:aminotransferase class I/II-fold pyridoxal phosphate-dependent enzyme [Thermoguttaceae bacterium]
VSLETDITELGLDSLERMEILAALEDRFGGQFPEEVLPTLFTAREVVDAVRKHLGGMAFAAEAGAKTYPVDDASCTFSMWPEVQAHQARFALARRLGMSHFFEPHEGRCADVITIRGKEYINYSSFNYIGTAGHPDVIAASQAAIEKYGTSGGASRIVCGELPLHHELESAIAKFLGTEDAVIFQSGHQTNECVIGHLMGAEDLVLHDSIAHNSIVRGCVLSGSRRRPFPHNEWESLDKILEQNRAKYRRALVIIEGAYSMDGDYPNLPEFIRVCKKHKTLLMVDEAHSLGVLGETGRGVGEFYNVNRKDVDIWMCTMSKTLGSVGGYIAGCADLVDYIRCTAPALMFATASSPATTAAALASLRVLQREPERAKQVCENGRYFRERAQAAGLDPGMANNTGVVPIMLGASTRALAASHKLFERGIIAHPILHPAVPEGQARVRFFLTSLHTKEQIDHTVEVLVEVLKEVEEMQISAD